MDVLEYLDKELKEKGAHWSLAEKSRFLYIQSCLLFSYDTRYMFCDLDLFYKIRDLKIDLHNVIDRRVTCSSHIKEVIKNVFQELLALDVIIKGTQHIWGYIKIDNQKIYLDSTGNSDLARVKIGLSTYGYSVKEKFDHPNEEYKDIDRTIGYIKDDYFDKTIQEKADSLYYEYYNYKNSNDYFHYKLNFFLIMVNELLSKFQIRYFADANFCVDYIFRKIISEKLYSLNQNLFNKRLTEEEWEFVNLYYFSIGKDTVYLILEKIHEFYEIKRISLEETFNYCNNFHQDKLGKSLNL